MPKIYIFQSISLICVISMCALFYSVNAKEDNESPAIGYQIVEYDNYVKNAERRIKNLKKTIELADKICCELDAVEFVNFMENGTGNPLFFIDPSTLSTEEKEEITALQAEMKTLNYNSFISLKRACKRIIDANGYGNRYLLYYFKQRFSELNNGTPSS